MKGCAENLGCSMLSQSANNNDVTMSGTVMNWKGLVALASKGSLVWWQPTYYCRENCISELLLLIIWWDFVPKPLWLHWHRIQNMFFLCRNMFYFTVWKYNHIAHQNLSEIWGGGGGEGLQGCALAVPGCHTWLTFAFGWLEKLFFFTKAWVLGIPDFIVGSLWALCNMILEYSLVLVLEWLTFGKCTAQ